MLRALLETDGVTEVCVLRGRVGLMAIHGGNLERVTDVIASEVADRVGASLYAVLQAAPLRHHLPSCAFDPEQSANLARFLAHVDVVVALHGYGREERFFDLLLGGQNRELAAHVGEHLRVGLPDTYRVVDDLSDIPTGLRGLHPENPVNRPRHGGLQIELPPTIRWNREVHEWSDHNNSPRAPHVQVLIEVLSAALTAYAVGASDRI